MGVEIDEEGGERLSGEWGVQFDNFSDTGVSDLPAGEYLIARTMLDKDFSKKIFDGIEEAEVNTSVIELLKTEDKYSCILGVLGEDALLAGQPVIGVPILDFIEGGYGCGVFFCALGSELCEYSDEYTFILPLDNELVVSGYVYIDGKDDYEEKVSLWKESQALKFMVELLGKNKI